MLARDLNPMLFEDYVYTPCQEVVNLVNENSIYIPLALNPFKAFSSTPHLIWGQPDRTQELIKCFNRDTFGNRLVHLRSQCLVDNISISDIIRIAAKNLGNKFGKDLQKLNNPKLGDKILKYEVFYVVNDTEPAHNPSFDMELCVDAEILSKLL